MRYWWRRFLCLFDYHIFGPTNNRYIQTCDICGLCIDRDSEDWLWTT